MLIKINGDLVDPAAIRHVRYDEDSGDLDIHIECGSDSIVYGISDADPEDVVDIRDLVNKALEPRRELCFPDGLTF